MIYNQISILLLQGTLVAFLILLLFRLRKRLGIGVLFACLGLFQFVQVFLSSTVAVSITNDFVVSPGSSVLFTASLFVLLIVYIKEEAKQTEKLIYTLLIVNVVMSTFLLTFGWNYTEVSTFNPLNVPTNLFDISAWVLVVSTIALFLDTLLIIIIFEFLSKKIRFLFLQICLTMLIVVSFDTVFFSMIAFWDSDNLKTILISGLVSKAFFAIFYSIIFYCYLRYFNVIAKKSFFFKTKSVFKSLTYKRKLRTMVNRIKMVEKERLDKLTPTGKELYFQNKDKGKRAIELSLANIELAYQHKEKGKRAVELALANIELAFQNEEKEKRAVELAHANIELAFQNEEKEQRADELDIANKELAFQNKEKEKRADELDIANKELAYQNKEKEKRAAELALANTELAYQNKEKDKRADELVIANKELAYQNKEREKRADELALANTELAFQNEEKEKRADELVVANKELAYQNKEKEKRADELDLANTELVFQNKEKEKRADELALANTELDYQNKEKEKRADELDLANTELVFQNKEKEKRADELALANTELDYQNKEKEKRADELAIANKELAYQNEEKEKRADELALANKELLFQNKEKEKRADELAVANNELGYQNKEKDKRANELDLANKKLAYENEEKEKRADELAVANAELDYQNKEKDKRADELAAANRELAYQNEEKEKRADELDIANKELAFQNEEKDKRAYELVVANKELAFQNEEKERRAKELRHFIETANAPIFGINSKGLINEWNQTSEKITGFTKKEVLGKDLLRTYITEDYREAVKKVLDDALLGKETANFEFPLFTKEGKRIMVLLNSTTGRNSAGQITGVLGVGQDITELVSYRKDLEFKVNERTIELNESLKKEIELNELKSRFVATASHEFRTPLSVINFAAGAIKKYWGKMEPAVIADKLTKIEDQVLHMTALLEDVLIFGQAEAGEISNKPLNLNLGDFICKIIEEIYSSTNKTHEILLVDNERLKKVDILMDEKLGRNIFGNLLSNAIKFSPDAKKITVELVSEKDNLMISITDYGIGILESDLKNIFKPFTRGENVDLIQGTGLGLSIVKESIHIIGGEISVQSAIGNGACFIVKIPKIKISNTLN